MAFRYRKRKKKVLATSFGNKTTSGYMNEGRVCALNLEAKTYLSAVLTESVNKKVQGVSSEIQ